ncbi:MAG: tripartite tricarboxylate transporter TctB family protein [Candidatus Rokubacteria bacterium]|nr:tripartite tricarboxylate transporter TctB family protein [Candidatus Rokubacteria bacterium]
MKISDTVVGVGFIGAGALIVAGTLNYPALDGGHPGPALFPRILGTLMAVLGAALAVQGARARDATQAVEWRRLHRNVGFVNALFVLGGVFAYLGLVEWLGFLITGTLLLFLMMWRLRVPPLRALVVAIAFIAIVHFLFVKVLRVPLPLGLLWW